MSDTVKLIIEFPKDLVLKGFENGFTEDEKDILIRAIGNGTPLDSVKAEFINRYPKNYMGEPELGGASCEFSLCRVLEILDNMGKAESEKLEQHTNECICRGSVHVDDMGRYDPYTDSFVKCTQ